MESLEFKIGVYFRERVCNFSLGFREFGPSDRSGPRRKVFLRGEDNAWVPVLGVFDKFREVGVLNFLHSQKIFKYRTQFHILFLELSRSSSKCLDHISQIKSPNDMIFEP